MTFASARLSSSFKERNFNSFSLVASSSKQIAERINVGIIDSLGVLDASSTSVVALSSTSYKVNMALSPSIKSGRYVGSFKVQICLDDPLACKQPYPGSPWLVPFEIDVKPWLEKRSVHKLLVSEAGFALTSTPNLSRLTGAINVTDNLGATGRWQAQSDQPWLKVTPSGDTGGTVQIEADPIGLPANTISYARISIASPDPTVVAPQPVAVAVWKGADLTREFAVKLPKQSGYGRPVFDPIRPHFYLSRQHSAGGVIDIVNVYTGVFVGTLTAGGANFERMIVSPDGNFLYAVDAAKSQLRVFDLRVGQLIDSWPLSSPTAGLTLASVDLLYARPNGVGVIVVTTGEIFRASDGKLLIGDMVNAPTSFLASRMGIDGSLIAGSLDGTRIYATGRFSPSTPRYWEMDYSEVNGGVLSLTMPTLANLDWNIGDQRLQATGNIAVSRDGKSVLIVENGISVWSPIDLSRTGHLMRGQHYMSVQVLSDGKMVVGSSDSSTREFYVLSSNGTLLKTIGATLAENATVPATAYKIYASNGSLAVSSDSNIAVRWATRQVDPYNDESLLAFTPIAP
ncbi:hypothetical protein [Xylophilus sp. Leaf220]|uniref:hypothetical protein n=1 Tax=Xylophilus sp. Leaf220 TaxID=1735686 RepID=UPI0012E2B234|nr:hypothetical protein [Xylophilus sp. Leaf220]